jgi:hypothetical protein
MHAIYILEVAYRWPPWLSGRCVITPGLIQSYDDTVETYAPELKGTYHGGVTLRHLSNMTSGAEIVPGLLTRQRGGQGAQPAPLGLAIPTRFLQCICVRSGGSYVPYRRPPWLTGGCHDPRIVHASADYAVLYPRCFTDKDSDLAALVSPPPRGVQAICTRPCAFH